MPVAITCGSSLAQLRDGVSKLAELAGPANTRWRLLPSPTAIQPVIIGDNHETLAHRRRTLRARPVGAGDPSADRARRAAHACASR
jgi:7-keto-8-aminopelargonate synthetase-like enzyme